MTDETVVEPQVTPAPEVNADAPPTEPVVKTLDADRAIEKMQRRIDELTWRLNQGIDRQANENREPAKPKVEPKAPRLEDFSYDEGKFQLAQTEYLRMETARLVADELNKAKQSTEAEKRTQTFREREKAFAAKTTDYQAKVYGEGVVPISDAMAEEITASDLGAELAYYLATHLDVARQLYELPHVQVAKEIGRLEALIIAPKAPVAPIVPKVSQAPPPPAKIEADEPEVERDPDKMTDTQFAKWRRRQISQRR